MNNYRDFATETLNTVIPVATSALIVENVASAIVDMTGYVASTADDGMIQIEHKKQLRESVEKIDEEIASVNGFIRKYEELGIDPNKIDVEYEKLERLENEKRQLTEKTKFRYFPNTPMKAWWNGFGAYGMAGEKVMNQLLTFTKDDLSSDEQKELESYLKQEFTYNDPMAGAAFPYNTMYNASDFIRKFMPSEWTTKPDSKIPTEIFWRAWLKTAKNPATVLERGRKLMAEK